MKYERGRFRAETITIRRLQDGSQIIFYDEQKIYLFPTSGFGAVFHRWGVERGFYLKSWKIFRQRLLVKKRLNYLLCFEIAASYNISSFSVHKDIEEIIGEKEVRYL